MTTTDATFDPALVPAIPQVAVPQAALPRAAIEQYRALARRLDTARHRGGPKAIAIISGAPGEGRTTTALYTAVALAGRGHRVLLADFDLRKPTLAARHDLPATPGVVCVVRGEATLDEALRLAPGAPGLTLLPAGEPVADPTPILHDERLRQMVSALTSAFDFVLCDTPPVFEVIDAACLGDLVGGALVVARAGRTRRRDLRAIEQALDGVPLVGCVLTGVSPGANSPSSRRGTAPSVRIAPGALALAKR
jgi:capsular exopolysaccharide synthesis family protein